MYRCVNMETYLENSFWRQGGASEGNTTAHVYGARNEEIKTRKHTIISFMFTFFVIYANSLHEEL